MLLSAALRLFLRLSFPVIVLLPWLLIPSCHVSRMLTHS
jgi:hypothetical protein